LNCVQATRGVYSLDGASHLAHTVTKSNANPLVDPRLVTAERAGWNRL